MLRNSHPVIGLSALICLAFISPALAQTVTSDGSIGTTVIGAGTYTITGGQLQGTTTLLHSFGDFSLSNTSDIAHFDLGNASYGGTANAVTTVIGRVTGGNPSTINGQISLTGGSTPDLFLINPNGIVFGAGATLNVPGSFAASTAESVLFNNGVSFGVDGTTPTPLLAISAPIGLQMGSSPAAITIQGAGHNLQLSNSSRVSNFSSLGTQGLQLQPGKTLALVGGDLALNGGLLSAPGGQIELGSVTSGSVTLNPNPQGFTLSYPNASSFGAIQMTQRALASTRGATSSNSGSIQFQGSQVSLREGSLAVIQNRSNQTAGNLTVNATESLQIIGKTPTFSASSALVNETTSTGAAGNIVINTPRLSIEQGGYVLDRTFSSAPGGNIGVNATDIRVDGFAAGDTDAFRASSALAATSHSTGPGGNVALATQNLVISSGGNVATRPYSFGRGGDVTVKADTVQITGVGAPVGNYFSLLSAATFGFGNAGNVSVDTRTLAVQAGARLSASSILFGGAGDLTVNASESIEVSGVKIGSTPSYIGTSILPLPGLVPSSNSGDTTLNTPVLKISDGATVFVQNQGTGNAGTLAVNANLVSLSNGGSISATTALGQGGNINLQLQSGLVMRYGSMISATAGGAGNSGNITINAPVIAGFENSDIIANAIQGNGGNIQITTQGIFGLQFRAQLTPENDITASSQFGVNGSVTIITPGIDPGSSLVELPANLSDSSQQITEGCSADPSNSFIATGRGGVPQSPNAGISTGNPWNDTRDVSAFLGQDSAATPATSVSGSTDTIVEISSWQINDYGQVELMAADQPSLIAANIYATCSNM